MMEMDYLRPEKARALRRLQTKIEEKGAPNAVEYENARILPRRLPHDKSLPPREYFGKGGVVARDGNYVAGSAVRGWLAGAYDAQVLRHSEKSAVYCGYVVRHWGHFLLETVTRLWYYLKNDRQDLVYVFVVDEGSETQLSGNIREFLALLGVYPRIEVLNQVTEYQRVIVPESAFEYGAFYTAAYREILDAVSSAALSGLDCQYAQKRIFLSRSRFVKARNTEAGLEMLDHYFRKNGFELVFPEEVHIAKLIAMLRQAETVASESGTAAHNFLFCCEGQRTIVVERQAMINEAQASIDQVRGLDTTYVDGNLAVYPVELGSGPYILYYSGQFRAFSEERGYLHPDEAFCSERYLKHCMKMYFSMYRRDHYLTMRGTREFEESYAPIQYEAYRDSEKVTGKYLRGEEAFCLAQMLDTLLWRRRFRRWRRHRQSE